MTCGGSSGAYLKDQMQNNNPARSVDLLLAGGKVKKVGVETVKGKKADHYSGTIEVAELARTQSKKPSEKDLDQGNTGMGGTGGTSETGRTGSQQGNQGNDKSGSGAGQSGSGSTDNSQNESGRGNTGGTGYSDESTRRGSSQSGILFKPRPPAPRVLWKPPAPG